MRRAVLMNVPNVISLSRFVLAGAFLTVNNAHVRTALLVVALASDFLDGWLARKYQLATRSGALIDAVADRGFVLVAVLVILADGLLSLGACLILLSRDIATASAYLVTRFVPMFRGATFKARFPGKLVTVIQFAVLVAALEARNLLGLLIPILAVASVVAIGDYSMALWKGRTRAAGSAL
jgi:phosphatidylglycerophosphate synthase